MSKNKRKKNANRIDSKSWMPLFDQGGMERKPHLMKQGNFYVKFLAKKLSNKKNSGGRMRNLAQKDRIKRLFNRQKKLNRWKWTKMLEQI